MSSSGSAMITPTRERTGCTYSNRIVLLLVAICVPSGRLNRNSTRTLDVNRFDDRQGEIMRYFLPLAILAIATRPVAFAGEDKDKKGTPVVPDGLKALKHTDPAVRYKAAAILGRLG